MMMTAIVGYDDDDCNRWWWWQWVGSPASETSSRFSGTTAFPGPTSLLTCKLITMRMMTDDVKNGLRGSVCFLIHLSTLCAGGSLATEFARISSVGKVKIGAQSASQHRSYFINGANIFPGMISRCSNIINITFMSLKTLPKAQRTRGLSSSCQSHIASSNANLDRISSSESWLSIN